MICKACGNETGHYAQHPNEAACRRRAEQAGLDREVARLRAEHVFGERIKMLMVGDIVRHKAGDAYVVVREATPTRPAVGVRTIEISNPSEWETVFPGYFGQR